jgi:hypothetical protein
VASFDLVGLMKPVQRWLNQILPAPEYLVRSARGVTLFTHMPAVVQAKTSDITGTVTSPHKTFTNASQAVRGKMRRIDMS